MRIRPSQAALVGKTTAASIALAFGLAACGGDDTSNAATTIQQTTIAGTVASPPTSPSPAAPTTTTPATTNASTTNPAATPPPTQPATTATASTSQPPAPPPTTEAAAASASTTPPALGVTPGPVDGYDLAADSVPVGYSVRGSEIRADRVGEIGGRRILIVGVIHGNENAGIQILDHLRTAEIPQGNELWLVDAMNPDGYADDVRFNANGVDLNRNFPYGWEPLGEPGDWQYAGTGPASEPETQAMVAFIEALQPDIIIWYHQDLYVIAPAKGRDGQVRARYAELTGLPLEGFSSPGAQYTGIAATWARRTLESIGTVSFIVELGPTLSDNEAQMHADAITTIATEF